jgi:hypothetical protein
MARGRPHEPPEWAAPCHVRTCGGDESYGDSRAHQRTFPARRAATALFLRPPDPVDPGPDLSERESIATRHPHGATDRQDDGAGWGNSTTEGLVARLRSGVERRQALDRLRRRRGSLGLVTGAAGGGPSFSMLGLSLER